MELLYRSPNSCLPLPLHERNNTAPESPVMSNVTQSATHNISRHFANREGVDLLLIIVTHQEQAHMATATKKNLPCTVNGKNLKQREEERERER